MKKLLALLALGFAMLAGPALASNCSSYPYTLTNGQTADANQVMANFNSILSCANTNLLAPPITNASLASGVAVANLGFTPLDIAGSNAMTGQLRLALGTTGLAPMLLQSGTNLTVPVVGSVEWDGTNLYLTNSGPTRRTVAYADGTNLGANAVALTNLATQAANTVLVNATSGTATPTAQAVSSCSTSTSALTWTTNTGFGCHTISSGGSGTVTSVACPNTTISVSGSCLPLAAAGTSGHVITAAGSNTIQDSGTTLASLAPLASPALTGNPTAPTQTAPLTSSTRIATTAYTDAAVAAGAGGAFGSHSGTPACSTGCSTVTGQDVAFKITSVSTTNTAAITFGTVWSANPICTATVSQIGGSAGFLAGISSLSTTGLNVNFSTLESGAVVWVICAPSTFGGS